MKTRDPHISCILKKNLTAEIKNLDEYLTLLRLERKALLNQDIAKLQDYVVLDRGLSNKLLTINKVNKSFIKIALTRSVLSGEDDNNLKEIKKKYTAALEINKANMVLLKSNMVKARKEIAQIKIPRRLGLRTGINMNPPVLIDIKT